MNPINNNQKQLLPYSGTTMPSCLQNNQMSISTSYPIMDTVSNLKRNINLGGPTETSFEDFTEYSTNLNSKFTKFNNKNQIILNLKKVTSATNHLPLTTLLAGQSGVEWSDPQTKTEFDQGSPNTIDNLISVDCLGGLLRRSGQSQPPKHLGNINILTPVKVNNNTAGFSSYESGLEVKERKNTFKGVHMDTTTSKHLNTFMQKFNLDIATSQYLVYSFNNSSASYSKKIIGNITSILKNSFFQMYGIISRPVLDISPNKIIINLFFFVSRNKNRRQTGSSYKNLKFLSTNHKQLQFLCVNLSKNLKKPVELELTRLYYPYNESQILANTIGLLSKNIRNRFRSLVDKTFNFSKIKNPSCGGFLHQKPTVAGLAPFFVHQRNTRISILPSFLTGIKIRLGGRLLSQKVIPRFTVQTFQEGSLARTKANVLTSSRFTHKNKRGTFSITVSVGQGFF